MPLLKPTGCSKKNVIRAHVSDSVMSEISAYCKWAHIQKESQFLEQAVKYILQADKEWLKVNRTNQGN